MYDLQKASMLKRVSAYILDLILILILIVGAAWGLASALDFDGYQTRLDEIKSEYLTEYNVNPDKDKDGLVSTEEYAALTDAEKAAYAAADEAFSKNEEAIHCYSMMLSLALLITSLSILASFLILEFAVPLIFGNGQTVGKKIFSIAVMHTNGTRVRTVSMFIRTLLGKYTVETMIPVIIILMLMFSNAGAVGVLLLFAILALELILPLATSLHSCLHDLIASTVTVDLASQMIFDSTEELLEYKKRIHREAAEKKTY